MSINVNVTGTYTAPKFKGIKTLDPILMKDTKELTDEELWEMILGIGYHQPHCPDCHTKLIISQFTLDYQISPAYLFGSQQTYFSSGFSWHAKIALSVVKVQMECPNCGNIINGFGTGLGLEEDSYYLKTLYVMGNQQEKWCGKN